MTVQFVLFNVKHTVCKISAMQPRANVPGKVNKLEKKYQIENNYEKIGISEL